MPRWFPWAALILAIPWAAVATEPPAREAPMRLGYTIVYVPDVEASLAFYERAFGLERRFVDPDGRYGELATGEATLAFASHAQIDGLLAGGFQPLDPGRPPQAFEVALVTDDVAGAYDGARAAGATPLLPPADKPWGQTVAYLRAPDGTLVELATPMPAPTDGPTEAPTDAAPGPPRHILTILAVADLDAAVAFYRAAFGWPARVEVPVYVELALPDGRGLGLYARDGFARNTGTPAAAVPAGATSGTEIYLHCDDLDATIARLRDAGARELSARAPRDWGDEAAYFADPDGNVLVVAAPLAQDDPSGAAGDGDGETPAG